MDWLQILGPPFLMIMGGIIAWLIKSRAEELKTIGEKLREIGKEYGATTGRPRRCGWLDLVALKYSIMLNGVTQIILTKTDILSEFETIKVCTAYKTKDGY